MADKKTATPGKAMLAVLGEQFQAMQGIYHAFIKQWHSELHEVATLEVHRAISDEAFSFAGDEYRITSEIFKRRYGGNQPVYRCRLQVAAKEPAEDGAFRLSGQAWFDQDGQVYTLSEDRHGQPIEVAAPYVLPADAGAVFFAMVTDQWELSPK
jgi:hypothetical protein